MQKLIPIRVANVINSKVLLKKDQMLAYCKPVQKIINFKGPALDKSPRTEAKNRF